MNSNNPKLTALWAVNPTRAKAAVKKALRSASTIAAAAEELGVTRRTLTRWMTAHEELRREYRQAQAKRAA